MHALSNVLERSRFHLALHQDGLERLPFLEGLSPLVARLPAKEAAALAAHLRQEAAALQLSDAHCERRLEAKRTTLPVEACHVLWLTPVPPWLRSTALRHRMGWPSEGCDVQGNMFMIW